MYRETTNAEPEMKDYTSNNSSKRNSNERFKEIFWAHTRKTCNTFTTRDSYTWNITPNKERTAVWAVGITVGSREVQVGKDLWQETKQQQQ